jgi:hypothetical protein
MRPTTNLRFARLIQISSILLSPLAFGDRVIFSGTGGDQSFIVPAGVTTLQVKAWGAGGSSVPSSNAAGGGGAFVKGSLAVTPGELITVVVGTSFYGGGGAGGPSQFKPLGSYHGNGGGRTALRRFTTELMTAAGGGGAGAGYPYGQHGGAAGAVGLYGVSISPALAGAGAIEYAGGAGGQNLAHPPLNGSAGGQRAGGAGGGQQGYSGYGGGGGGGGYFGGGGGAGGLSGYPGGAGGGGGSSYTGFLTSITVQGATGATPGGASDPDYVSGVGTGGTGGAAGGSGRLIIEYTPDTVTAAPTLNKPAPSTAKGNPIEVQFLLPENAQPGSLKLTFSGSSSRTLTLASSQLSSGQHDFSFDPQNPLASPQISSISGGPSLPDGVYTVTLGYQDQYSNPEATATIGDFRVDTASPSLLLPNSITMSATTPTGAPVTYTVNASDPDGSGIASLVVTPPSGSQFPVGTTVVTATAVDQAGNSANGSFQVTITANAMPTFAGYSVATAYQTAATISLGKLLSKAADADGDAFSVTAAGPNSAQSGTAVLQSGSILYTPPPTFSGTDTFSVTITDARGGSVIGTVSVSVGPNPNSGGQGTNSPQLTILPGGHVDIAFQGIPGRSYQVQRSIDLSNWTPLNTVVAASNGAVTFTDTSPPEGSAFYRLRKP